MRLHNVTPHDVVVHVGDDTVRVPRRTDAPRVTVVEDHVDLDPLDIDGVAVPLVALRERVVDGLPEARPGVLLIASRVVAAACPDRADIVVPVDLVRDAEGRVIGCRALGRPAVRVGLP